MREVTLVVRRSDVSRALTIDACIGAVENAFGKLGQKKVPAPAILGVPGGAGGFHIKAGLFDDGQRRYFAAKCNGNFSDNMARFGLPAIQGLIILCDAESGFPLAVMDSIEITLLRTGAATAVAAKYLARADSRVVTICGCGNQGRIQLKALTRVLPIVRAYVFDADPTTSARFASSAGAEFKISSEAVSDVRAALHKSDVCVTCTPARRPFLLRDDVPPGMFIAAVGADAPNKQELEPMLLKQSTVVVDLLDQCATIGELHHALDARLMTRADVHAELGEIVAGTRPGRRTKEEITIFDSTGIAVQDAASAVAVFDRLVDDDEVTRIPFNNFRDSPCAASEEA